MEKIIIELSYHPSGAEQNELAKDIVRQTARELYAQFLLIASDPNHKPAVVVHTKNWITGVNKVEITDADT